jgi:hypothetical protein
MQSEMSRKLFGPCKGEKVQGLLQEEEEFMSQDERSEYTAEEFQASGKYEYGFHPDGELTLQIFNTRTMSSSFFTGQETLDLLRYLEQYRRLIEAAAKKYGEHAHHAH